MIWPLIYICITLFGLGILISKNELSFISLSASVIIWFILYMGNFFDPIIKAL